MRLPASNRSYLEASEVPKRPIVWTYFIMKQEFFVGEVLEAPKWAEAIA